MQEHKPINPDNLGENGESNKIPSPTWDKGEKFTPGVKAVSKEEMDTLIKMKGVRRELDLTSALGDPKKEGNMSEGHAPIALVREAEKPRSWIRRLFG